MPTMHISKWVWEPKVFMGLLTYGKIYVGHKVYHLRDNTHTCAKTNSRLLNHSRGDVTVGETGCVEFIHVKVNFTLLGSN